MFVYQIDCIDIHFVVPIQYNLIQHNTIVPYMCSSFWQLGVESRDNSHAEKERNACKAEQIHRMTTIFTQMVLVCRKRSICKKLHIDRRQNYRKDFYVNY